MFLLLLLYVGIGLLSILIALPLLLEMVKPNPIYGFRVRTTLENETVWYAVNKFFAQRLMLVGIVEVVAALVLYFLPGISLDGYAIAVMVLFAVAFSVAMAQSFRYLKSLSN